MELIKAAEFIIRAKHRDTGAYTHLVLMTNGGHRWRYGFGIRYTPSETEGLIKPEHATRFDLESAVRQYTMACESFLRLGKEQTWLTDYAIVMVED